MSSLLNDIPSLFIDVSELLNEFFLSVSSYYQVLKSQPLIEFLCSFLYCRRVLTYLIDCFQFSDFQVQIVKILLSLLLLNILLIVIAWNFFGKQIVERFAYFATARAIEELKASVARLKLPKFHTPRA